MIYLIETDYTYEALVALLNKTLKELNKGTTYDVNDLMLTRDYITAVENTNRLIHKKVVDLENKRYGGHKSICVDLTVIIDDLINKAKQEPKQPDFENMTREELLAFIKERELDKDKPEPDLEEKKPEEAKLVLKDPEKGTEV